MVDIAQVEWIAWIEKIMVLDHTPSGGSWKCLSFPLQILVDLAKNA